MGNFPVNDNNLLEAIRECLAKKINFAAYRLPNNNETIIVIQNDAEVKEIDEIGDGIPEKGFLVYPFSKSKNNKTYIIRPDILIRNKVSSMNLEKIYSMPVMYTEKQEEYPDQDTGKREYIESVNKIVKSIRSGEVEKVVLSKVKYVKGNYYSKLTDIFYNLTTAYSSAFVYLFSIKGRCWAGASPEPFVCSGEKELHTVSLAGTRAYDSSYMEIEKWNHKELSEQEYVTSHIDKTLADNKISGYKKHGPYVSRAGNLIHLRTDLSFAMPTSLNGNIAKLISTLHPTPAVCGISTEKAMSLINKVEKHNREYYSGFLGPVGIDGLMQLYVNLRCMKIYDNGVLLFTGGGITSESTSEEEWKETEIKTETLLTVLDQVK